MTLFFAAVTGRDKIKSGDGYIDFSEFLTTPPDGWLMSLPYLPRMLPKTGRKIIDCGAWTYRKNAVPELGGRELTPSIAIETALPQAKSGDFVVAPDHMYLSDLGSSEWKSRKELNHRNAAEFIDLVDSRFVPMGVAHGETTEELLECAHSLWQLGYRHIALGGLAAMAARRKEVVRRVRAVVGSMPKNAWIHALGVSAPFFIQNWHSMRVSSFDGSTYFHRALVGKEFMVLKDKNLVRLDIRKDNIPKCGCRACLLVSGMGGSTLEYGNELNNLGRAAHNLNQYIELNNQWKKSP